MPKSKDVGIIKQKNGLFAYRFTMLIDGKQVTKRKTVDEYGNKLKTRQQAIRARLIAMENVKTERKSHKVISRRTIKEIFDEYAEKGRAGKAYKTILKQDSLWKNHLCKRWGKH